MKLQNNKRSAWTSSKKGIISNDEKGLTCQAGLLPVVKFLRHTDMPEAIKETIDHKRGDNALYDTVDAVFLTVVAVVGGAQSLQTVTTIWADGVLLRLSGCLSIHDDSKLGQFFKKLQERQVSQLETLNHRLRGKIWRKALRCGTGMSED